MPDLYFKTNAKVERLVGRELITNNIIAIFELVKNSYDAGAKQVEIKFTNFYYHEGNKSKIISNEESFIEVIDDGKGMTLDDIKNNWMQLGTPYKEYNKFEEVRLRKNLVDIVAKRNVNGEKGIGRFGVDKIGSYLIMESIDRNIQSKTIVQFNWEDFDDRNKLIEQIPCKYEILKANSNDKSGLKLKIMNLRDKWSWNDVQKLKGSMKKFLSPIGIEQDEFKILLTYPDLKNNEIIYVTEEILNDSFEYLKTNIYGELSKNGILYYEIYDKDEVVVDSEIRLFEESPFGNVEASIYYLDSSDKKRFTEKMGLRTNQYGNIKIFRDNFRVMPYGEPHNDWLEIDNKHAQGVFRTFGTRDLVGYILLSHDPTKGNYTLREATDRVGLIEDVPEFEQFRGFVWRLIEILQEYIFNRIEKEAKETTEILKNESINLKSETSSFINSFKSILNKAEIPKEQKSQLLDQLSDNSKKLMKNIERVEVASKEIDKKIKIYSQITGAEGFLFNMMHKIKNKLAVIDAQLEDFEIDIKKSKLNLSTYELKIAFSAIRKMVEGTLKTINASRAKKYRFAVKELIDEAIKYQLPRFKHEEVIINNIFNANNIMIKGNKDALLTNVFENLFDNAFKALLNSKSKEITINTKISKEFVEIFFSDNGSGIPEDKINYVFSLWSSNTDGSGIGLATARDTIKDHGGEIMYVDMGEPNLRTTFLIKLPIV